MVFILNMILAAVTALALVVLLTLSTGDRIDESAHRTTVEKLPTPLIVTDSMAESQYGAQQRGSTVYYRDAPVGPWIRFGTFQTPGHAHRVARHLRQPNQIVDVR